MINSLFHKICHIFTVIWKTLLDALFPIRCLRCGIFDQWICTSCHSTLPILTEQHCPSCMTHITLNGEVCPPCSKKYDLPYSGIFVVSYYKDPLVRSIIHHFKYRFIKDLAKPLALLIAQSLNNSHFPTPDLIIPIPLHPRRKRWRGFNQAEELSHSLDLQIPTNTDILRRVRYTKPQVTMRNRDSRLNNVSGAFIVQNPSRIKNKNILLIDDVMTTGATITACAHELKLSGAKNIYALVIARE